MRHLIPLLIILAGCAGQEQPGRVTIQLDDPVETSAMAGDREVLVGSWDINQDRYNYFSLNSFELYALVWHEDKGRWGSLIDVNLSEIPPECFVDPDQTEASDNPECYIKQRPIKNEFQTAFDQCWLNVGGSRVSSGFGFDTNGFAYSRTMIPSFGRGDIKSVDLVCDLAEDAPQVDMMIELRSIEGTYHLGQHDWDTVRIWSDAFRVVSPEGRAVLHID